MSSSLPSHGRGLTLTLTAESELRTSLVDLPVTAPGPDEVVVRIEAAPINPSDILQMIGSADPSQARFEESTVTVPATVETKSVSPEVRGQSQLVGLEGAGIVVAAGRNAQSAVGKNVAILSLGKGLFAQYRTIPLAECTILPAGTTPLEGASPFVNPMTVLAMTETLPLEGHKALIHTAAASALGQMLVKVCAEDGIPLVNVVRKQAQVDLLRSLGAAYVCNSTAPTFRDDLNAAVKATGATVAFDAVGGGGLVAELLLAMENGALSRMSQYSPYGSMEKKQVYIYGHLDSSPATLFHGSYGMSWSVGGWAMPWILQRIGPERTDALRNRIVNNLKTTFATRYTKTVSLADMLSRDVMLGFHRQATGEKYLLDPWR
jgi:NADPH:quinone reductase-like Zn-dependent oxidoreductase